MDLSPFTLSVLFHDSPTSCRKGLPPQAQCVEMDGQGRVRIDPELAQLGQLGKEVVLVGVGDRIELWGAERWESYRSEQQSRYDEIAENAFREGS